jgi:succinate dehydrogenase / fumarate reductase, cytochrome b subunit
MTQAKITFYSTSVGKKVVMAVSGVIAFGFVLVHMLGNLQIYLGSESLDRYARFLHSLGGGLWAFRGIMVIAILFHLVAATQVTLQSMNARPKGYRIHRFRETTYAARTMWWGGPLIALFVIYHLLHLTFGTVHPAFEESVYNNVVFGFQVPWVSGVYIVAMIILGLHLSHGLWSMFQSIGLNHPKWNRWRQVFAILFGLGIAAGNISIPIAVLIGVIKPD